MLLRIRNIDLKIASKNGNCYGTSDKRIFMQFNCIFRNSANLMYEAWQLKEIERSMARNFIGVKLGSSSRRQILISFQPWHSTIQYIIVIDVSRNDSLCFIVRVYLSLGKPTWPRDDFRPKRSKIHIEK